VCKQFAPGPRKGPGIPRSWTSDPDHCRAAGLGEEADFATKPELARAMIERFLDAGHHAGWITGAEDYGGNPKLRTALEERGIGYVVAVACSAEVPTGAGSFRADALARKVPKRAWQKLSAGRGAKGQRFYDWAVVALAEAAPGRHQLLIRRNRTTGELAYYRCHSTTPAPLPTLVWDAGSRWRVEETVQSGKGLAGLDEHQVRRYPSWARWVTLAMLAHAFLAVVRADEHAHQPTPDHLIPLTCNEIQRLFITVAVRPDHDPAHGAGVPGELEGDLLVVAGFEVGVLPREHGGDECLVRGAVQREFGFDQAVGVVEHGVRVTHRRPAASFWSWSPGLASGAWTARKRA
jgi:hypothetical protein